MQDGMIRAMRFRLTLLPFHPLPSNFGPGPAPVAPAVKARGEASGQSPCSERNSTDAGSGKRTDCLVVQVFLDDARRAACCYARRPCGAIADICMTILIFLGRLPLHAWLWLCERVGRRT